MKNIVLNMLLLLAFQLTAQDFSRFLQPLASAYGLSEKDVTTYRVSSNYHRSQTNMQHVYLQQLVGDVPVFNAMFQLHIWNQEIVKFHNSRFIPNAEEQIDALIPELTLDEAHTLLKAHLHLDFPDECQYTAKNPQEFLFDCPDYLINPIRSRMIFFPNDGVLNLGYEFALEPRGRDAFTVIISAVDGAILWSQNRTIKCHFEHDHQHVENCAAQGQIPHENFETRNLGQAGYNAYPLGIESPIHGPRALLNAEELPLASPFGWHDTNGAPGAEFTFTRGNNVYAHEDTAALDIPGYAPDGGPDLNFDFPFFEGADPVLSMDASITNLFVWNNYLHDISFFYGFDEVSGNFQQTNYSGDGVGNDFVFAHAFDGSGTNNANFGTPEEGFNPVMQMYIWNHISGALLEVLEPSLIADSYTTGSPTFGVDPPSNPIQAEIMLVSDGSGSPTLGCGTLVNSAQLQGKIAYFDRGACTFVQKVQNAQNAGAVAAIIANNQQGGAMSMGGNDNGILEIPVLSISQADGALIKSQLELGIPVLANFGGEFDLITHDSSFDNGIIAHEYGHGISNRLTGGPYQVNCLWNDEQMGEGWSDFFALIVSDTLGASGEMPRGIGNFASNRPAGAFGIRPFPYTTDMSVNPLTYQNINGLSIPHGVGSVWATMIWDLYWALVDVYGHSHDLYSMSGGNNKAIHLVMEGMRLQACNPGFVDGRDAILAADNVLYNGDNQCLIWEVFARRGLGESASQGSSQVVGDEQEAFDIPSICTASTEENSAQNLDFILYPNPGNANFQIKALNGAALGEITILNISGQVQTRLTSEDPMILIETESWSKGVYIIQIQNAYGVKTMRWVKHN